MHYLEKELAQRVKDSSSFFNFLQMASVDGLWYWDLENPEYEWMSPEFWITFGYNPSEKKHLASEWMDMIHPDDLATATENFHKHLENPNYPYDQIVRYRHKNGSTVWVRCRGMAYRDPDTGKPLRMLGAHNNLTNLMESEEIIAALKQQINALYMRVENMNMRHALLQDKYNQLSDKYSQLLSSNNES